RPCRPAYRRAPDRDPAGARGAGHGVPGRAGRARGPPAAGPAHARRPRRLTTLLIQRSPKLPMKRHIKAVLLIGGSTGLAAAAVFAGRRAGRLRLGRGLSAL